MLICKANGGTCCHATEATAWMLDVLRDHHAVVTVYATVDPQNAPSIRLLERIGMRLHHSREVQFKGEACIERVYVMARTDWSPTVGA